jgi:hypothetical protein
MVGNKLEKENENPVGVILWLNDWMKKIITFIGFVFLSITIFGQTSSVSLKVHDVMDMFGNSKEGVWITHYAGISTEGDSYIFTLGHNAKEYKGILQNISKNELQIAEGTYKAEEIKLVLLDTAFDMTGLLSGEILDAGLMVRILDKRKEKGRYIEFEKVNRDGFKVLACPSQIWYQSFNGVLDRDPVFIQLQKEKDQRIYGTISVPSRLSGYILAGNCEDSHCKNMNLRVYDFFGERVKEYKATTPEPNRVQVEEFYKDKFQIFENWITEHKFNFLCKNMSMPAIRLYAQYIQIDDKDFNLWIENFITKWTEQVISFYQPGNMQEQRDAIAGMDIDWISDDWVSGIFRFTEPWSEVERSLPFTYDRRQNRIISIEEIFDKDFDYKSYFSDVITKKKKQMMTINTSNRFRGYMDVEYFSHWTLRPEGFCFTSEFNSVWGTRKIIIPYAQIQEKIRRGGPLRKLF